MQPIRKPSSAINLAFALFSVAQLSAQDHLQKVFGPLTIDTPEGVFELSDIRLWEYSSLRPGFIGPRPSGLIENKTGTTWEKLELMAEVKCNGLPSTLVPIFLYNIGATETQRFKSRLSDADNFCEADLVEVKFDHGTNARSTERAGLKQRQQAANQQAEEAAQHAAEGAAERERLSQKIVMLRVPKDFEDWAGTDDCPDALRLYDMRAKTQSEITNHGPRQTQSYKSGRKVAVVSRAGNCAEVRFIEEGLDLYVASLLVPQSQEEHAAAARFAKIEKERADRAAALAKLQADLEAQQRAHDAAERAKLQAACTSVFKATGNKKVSDLTVVESQQVQACTALGMYHP